MCTDVCMYKCKNLRNTSSVNSMLEALDWPTLERHHQISRLYKIHSGLVHCLSLKSKLPPAPPPLASAKVMTSSSSSSYQEHSTGALPFLPRAIKDWNCLPKEVVKATMLDTFASRASLQRPIPSPHYHHHCPTPTPIPPELH